MFAFSGPKHHWFARVGRAFSLWKRAARQALEGRLRLALLLRKKRLFLLHAAFCLTWRPYTDALRELLQRKLNRALAYWRNSGMMRAFMGWRDAVAQGLALRAALRVSQRWRMRHQCGGALRRWRVDTVVTRLRIVTERRQLALRIRQWEIFVSDSQTERRFLQRAGRRWRSSSKRRCLRRWRAISRARAHLRGTILRAVSRLGAGAALQWAIRRWVGAVAAMSNAEREHRLHAQLHADGLCDCVRQRFGPRGGRERMLRWKREEAEENAWLRKEKLRKREKTANRGKKENRAAGPGDVGKAELAARRARRAEFLRLKKQRKRRHAMKKKLRELKTI